jgi:predicted PurR-regulated permease PerM
MAGAVVAAIIIGALYVGREIFIPIALAVLLSFVLAPLVRLLQQRCCWWCYPPLPAYSPSAGS